MPEITNSVAVSSKGNLITISFSKYFSQDSELNSSQAEYILDQVSKIIKVGMIKDYFLLSDITKSESPKFISPRARKEYVKIASIKTIKKFAVVFKESLFIKTVQPLIMKTAGRGRDLKLFHSIREAKNWLAEQ